jgi:hypothetical protein
MPLDLQMLSPTPDFEKSDHSTARQVRNFVRCDTASAALPVTPSVKPPTFNDKDESVRSSNEGTLAPSSPNGDDASLIAPWDKGNKAHGRPPTAESDDFTSAIHERNPNEVERQPFRNEVCSNDTLLI